MKTHSMKTTATTCYLHAWSAAMLVVLGACSAPQPLHGVTIPTVVQADLATPAGRAAHIAADQVGMPYRYGGATPAGFDCSGLVYYAYQQSGLTVPRTSKAQFNAASPVSFQAARPGDLLFFASRKKVNHVGIYIGNNTFVHSPAKGKHVTVGQMSNPYYREHFVGAGRLDP
jgi:murein DD-endopeptidase